MRFARRVRDHRLARREGRCHHGVLGRHHRRLVEVDVRPLQGAGELVPLAQLEVGTELLEGVEVRVEPAPADHVTARRGHDRAAVTCEQRPGEQERGADLARELRVDLVGDVRRMHTHLVRAEPLDLGAEVCEQAAHRLDVADVRDVGKRDRLLGEEACCEDRQGAVLVAGCAHPAGERVAPLDHERLRQRSHDGRGHGSALC